MALIFPSLISADLLRLGQEITLLEPACAGFHLDVMDFHFVPNLTWGPDFINAIRRYTRKDLQVHLMVDYPERYLDRLHLHDHDIVCVHIESPSSLPFTQLLAQIRNRGWTPSVAINPHTPLEALITLNYPFQHVLLMSVNPGYSGQQFLPHTVDKLRALNNFRRSHNLTFTIAMDGGINQDTVEALITNGADQMAIASAIFTAPDQLEALKQITKACHSIERL